MGLFTWNCAEHCSHQHQWGTAGELEKFFYRRTTGGRWGSEQGEEKGGAGESWG